MGFGSFNEICSKTAFPLCSVVGSVDRNSYFSRGVIALCYARPVELANTMIFQIGNAFVHIGTLIFLLVIIFNIRAKYTAIGRTEMLHLMYTLIGLSVSSLIVDCGVSPPSSSSYAYFVCVQLGLAGAVCVSLLFNGIICFQFWEDGTRKSMWALRLVSVVWFLVNFMVPLITFKGWNTALDDRKTTTMFVVNYVINAIVLLLYVVSQIILVIFALDNYWPMGAILLGVFFFVVGQVLVYVFNSQVCNGLSHYVDALFFGSLANLFAVMMIYKFWDIITTDDLEFSVASVEQGIKAFSDDEKRQSAFFN